MRLICSTILITATATDQGSMSDDGRDGDASACSGGHASPPLTVTLAGLQQLLEEAQVVEDDCSEEPASEDVARPRRKTRGRKAKGAAERSSGGAPLLNKKKNSKGPMEDQDWISSQPDAAEVEKVEGESTCSEPFEMAMLAWELKDVVPEDFIEAREKSAAPGLF